MPSIVDRFFSSLIPPICVNAMPHQNAAPAKNFHTPSIENFKVDGTNCKVIGLESIASTDCATSAFLALNNSGLAFVPRESSSSILDKRSAAFWSLLNRNAEV